MGCTIRRTDGFTESDIPFSDGRCGVSETPDSAGEPGAGNWHAGFGEQRVETWFMVELRTHPHNRKGGNRHSLHLPMRAPLFDSTTVQPYFAAITKEVWMMTEIKAKESNDQTTENNTTLPIRHCIFQIISHCI